MLRSNEEQYKYFYIDRKLGSGSQLEINEALDDIDLALPHMKKIDLVNSLVMRMLDLMQTARSFQIKGRLADLFRRHSRILIDTHSKDQIAVVLAKCVKGADQYTRITAMRMVRTLPSLFVKDIAIYHTLLSKISQQNCLSREQKKEAILSLITVLASSKQLCKLFSRNITQLQQLYRIPLHVVIYLLTHISVDSHLQKQIIEETALLVGEESNRSANGRRKEIKYFGVLVMNYANYNYRILDLYHAKLRGQLPQLEQPMRQLQIKRYPFLKSEGTVQLIEQGAGLTMEEFIEELYSRKQEGNYLAQYQDKICSILNKVILVTHQKLFQAVLLLYFLSADISDYDQAIAKLLNTTSCRQARLFKVLATVGSYRSSLKLLDCLAISQQNFVFLRLYFQFKISNSKEHLWSILQVLQILHPHAYLLFKIWYLLDEMLGADQTANLSQKQQQVQSIFTSLKGATSFQQQLQVIALILHSKNYGNAMDLQRKCYHLLPSSLLTHSHFWFAHLSKTTILSLCQPRG